MSLFYSYVRLLRPLSWTKNVFVFAALFFARGVFNVSKLIPVLWAFAVFSLAASMVYIFNDLLDAEQDRKHPTKRNRPIASGKVSVSGAIILLLALVSAIAGILWKIVPSIWPYITTYIVLNMLYSVSFKHVAVVDIILVSSFYLIRVMVGGAAAGVPVSQWLLLCTIFLSLFLIIGKRRAEYSQTSKRAVLSAYTPQMLDTFLTIAIALTIISYSLYTVLVLKSDLAVLTIFLVLTAILRYTLLIHTTEAAERPETAIWSDPVMVLSGLGWGVAMLAVFYYL